MPAAPMPVTAAPAIGVLWPAPSSCVIDAVSSCPTWATAGTDTFSGLLVQLKLASATQSNHSSRSPGCRAVAQAPVVELMPLTHNVQKLLPVEVSPRIEDTRKSLSLRSYEPRQLPPVASCRAPPALVPGQALPRTVVPLVV